MIQALGHFHVEIAHDGGYFRSGSNDFKGEFPVLLKSNEYVLTEQMVENLKNKISDGVDKTPISTAFPEAMSTTSSGNDLMFREMQQVNVEMMEMISTKLDAMIDALGTSNDLQGKLVTYSRV